MHTVLQVHAASSDTTQRSLKVKDCMKRAAVARVFKEVDPVGVRCSASQQCGRALSSRGSASTPGNSWSFMAVRVVVQYESRVLQARALDVIPIKQLLSAAEEAASMSAHMHEQPPLAAEDALARELLGWFKTSFFAWVSHGTRSSRSAAARIPHSCSISLLDRGRLGIYLFLFYFLVLLCTYLLSHACEAALSDLAALHLRGTGRQPALRRLW